MTTPDYDAVLAREEVLIACAALFDEVFTYMETVVPRTFADYDSAEPGPAKDALRIKHLQALRIRDEYRNARNENQDDTALLRSLRQAAQPSDPQPGMEPGTGGMHPNPREGTEAS